MYKYSSINYVNKSTYSPIYFYFIFLFYTSVGK